MKEWFRDDVIISCLCVGYLIPYADVKCKRLIVNALDDAGNPIAKEIKYLGLGKDE